MANNKTDLCQEPLSVYCWLRNLIIIFSNQFYLVKWINSHMLTSFEKHMFHF